MKQNYPLGQQDFKSLRERGDVYVDKTKYIPMLIKKQFYFLSRPRRFGKSLFLSTLECFFSGQRDLFKGLAVESLDWEWEEFPVIDLDFTGENYHVEGNLEAYIHWMLQKQESRMGVETVKGSVAVRFENLIIRCAEKFGRQVVILIDEYEKALLDVFDSKQLFSSHRNCLSAFYSVIKKQSENIKFVFITGITRFGHLNIFSGLNNLTDISLDDEYEAICGITEVEIREFLMPGISSLSEKLGCDPDATLSLLKKNYDGYHFSKRMVDVYNPYSLLTALSKGETEYTWFTSGSSSFLLERLRESQFDLFNLLSSRATRDELLGLDPEMMNSIPLLYQSGYLTIKDYNPVRKTYQLGLPNLEVKDALLNAVIPFYLGKKEKFTPDDRYDLFEMIENGDANGIVDWLKKFFLRVSYNVKLLPLHDRLRQESDFQFVIYAIFALASELGNIELEYATSFGRIDLVLKGKNYIYIFEFKLGEDAASAIRQIEDKDYAAALETDSRKVFKIGISFSSETRTISEAVIRD